MVINRHLSKYSSLIALVTTLFFSGSIFAQTFVNTDAQKLEQTKVSLQNKTASAESLAAYQELLSQADELLATKNQSVMDKGFTAPSEDKHDYLSLSRYWWPDPSKEDGLPWIRKDGQTNPDTQKGDVDKGRIEFTTKSIQDLSYAYYYSGNEKYAEKGVSQIRTWFLDDATRMNPNLQYAQSVPGNDNGRRSGILDGRIIPQRVLDSITIFSASKYWTADDEKKMNAWLTEYLTWLTESDLGKEGAKQTNNHGSWYAYQVSAIALYLDKTEKIAPAVELAQTIFAGQFDKEGAQPHELERTRSYFYSAFNLDALTAVAMVADKADISFWDTKAENGATLLTGIDFLIPAANGAEWTYNISVQGVVPDYLIPSLARIPQDLRSEAEQSLLDARIEGLKNNDKKELYQEKMYFRYLLKMPLFI
ncbi:alginate lyase family protein [Psychromonas aquatilis]|uniref:Alginate lyase family protein n=1 Tax=Psychromonas aquatilis TaxID=2005072 RepID=A0ABU9GQT7_9GAMM